MVALSAAKCVPFSSCNGGAFGGHHHERYPVVAFYAPVQVIGFLIALAEGADIGLEGSHHLDAYANDIRKMRAFAGAVVRKRRQFSTITTRRSKSKAAKDQYDLPLA